MAGARRGGLGGALGADAGALFVELILYKSVFIGSWFEHVSSGTPDLQDELLRIRRETPKEEKDTVDVIHLWNRFPRAREAAEKATQDTRRRLLQNLVSIKEGSTEVFLGAGMLAPTTEIRDEMIRLADMDRAHADGLRRLLGVDPSSRPRREASVDEPPLGAYAGRSRGGSLRGNVEAEVERIRENGVEPVRLVVSGEALRHLRDEGAVDMDRGTVCGLPAEVDFGWIGECFSIITGDRVALAEIVAAARAPPQEARQFPER